MRKGYGINKGQGYKNLLLPDSYVHSLNAKGVKQKRQEFVRDFETMRGLAELRALSNISLERPLSDKEYQRAMELATKYGFKRKGLIKEIARKAVDGVKWAVEWEKQHLPAQEEWVKKEFNEAKDLAKRGYNKIKKDMDDVRDELDTDNDGEQDLSLEELQATNQVITNDLDKIDTDNSGVPDYKEEGFETFDVPKPPISIFKPTFKQQAGKVLGEIKELGGKAYEFGRAELTKRELESFFIKEFSDDKLFELGIREGKPFFGSYNKYERELLRRTREREFLKKQVEEAKLSADKPSRPLFDFSIFPLFPLQKK